MTAFHNIQLPLNSAHYAPVLGSTNCGPLLKTLLGSYFFFSFCSWAKLSPKTCVPPTPIPEEISGSIDNQPAQQVEELTVIVEVFTYACPSSQNLRIFICETLLPRKGREKTKGSQGSNIGIYHLLQLRLSLLSSWISQTPDGTWSSYPGSTVESLCRDLLGSSWPAN